MFATPRESRRGQVRVRRHTRAVSRRPICATPREDRDPADHGRWCDRRRACNEAGAASLPRHAPPVEAARLPPRRRSGQRTVACRTSRKLPPRGPNRDRCGGESIGVRHCPAATQPGPPSNGSAHALTTQRYRPRHGEPVRRARRTGRAVRRTPASSSPSHRSRPKCLARTECAWDLPEVCIDSSGRGKHRTPQHLSGATKNVDVGNDNVGGRDPRARQVPLRVCGDRWHRRQFR